MRLTQSGVIACVAASSLLGVADPASAQSTPGVHVDPGSPSGREYAVPLEATRRDFSTQRKRTPTRRVAPRSTTPLARPAPPPRFGAGVTPARNAAKKPARTRSAERRTSANRRTTAPAGPQVPAPNTASTVNTTALSAGIVAAVLLVALGLAALIRLGRRRRA